MAARRAFSVSSSSSTKCTSGQAAVLGIVRRPLPSTTLHTLVCILVRPCLLARQIALASLISECPNYARELTYHQHSPRRIRITSLARQLARPLHRAISTLNYTRRGVGATVYTLIWLPHVLTRQLLTIFPKVPNVFTRMLTKCYTNATRRPIYLNFAIRPTCQLMLQPSLVQMVLQAPGHTPAKLTWTNSI